MSFEAALGARVAAALRGVEPGLEVARARAAARRPLRADLSRPDVRRRPSSSRRCPRASDPVGRHDMLRQARILQALAPIGRAGAARSSSVDETETGVVRHGVRRRRVARAGARRSRRRARRSPRHGCAAPPRSCRRCTTCPSTRSRSTARALSPADELAALGRDHGGGPARARARSGRRSRRGSPRQSRRPSTPTLVHGDYRLGNIISTGLDPAARHRLGDLERRRPARRARLVPGVRRRRQLPRRGPRGPGPAQRGRAASGCTAAARSDGPRVVQRAGPLQDGRDHGPQPAPAPRGPPRRPRPGTSSPPPSSRSSAPAATGSAEHRTPERVPRGLRLLTPHDGAARARSTRS